VLTIAGSDSGGGAGIQADLKTFAALGVYGMSVITALTAQNTREVRKVASVPADFVAEQIDAVVDDIEPHATKTGMLGSADVVDVVAAKVVERRLRQLVVDPVLRATTGAPLLADDALDLLRHRLLPMAAAVTPNLEEAQVLAGIPVRSLPDMQEAARRIQALGPRWVIVTGGHLDGDAVDILLDGSVVVELRGPRLAVTTTHGTGCSFASAVAAGLARGLGIAAAASDAKDLVTNAIKHGYSIGKGRGPINQLASLYQRSGPARG
jgi:hydroxymethylpyrimidine/phosphomethylpyrimidine kinase